MKDVTILILTVFLTCNGLRATGQSKYKQGYVITIEKDTIFGKLRNRSKGSLAYLLETVRMKTWLFEKRYKPSELLGYKIENDFYESIWYDTNSSGIFTTTHASSSGVGKKVFMRREINGKLKLYWEEVRDVDDGYDLQIPYFKNSNSTSMVRVTQGLLGFKKKKLSSFFSDCPSLVEKMNIGFFNTAAEMAQYYNSTCE